MSSSAIRYCFISMACMVCPIVCPAQNLKQNFNRNTAFDVISFQVPRSYFTGPAAINDALTVTGTYTGHSFLGSGQSACRSDEAVM